MAPSKKYLLTPFLLFILVNVLTSCSTQKSIDFNSFQADTIANSPTGEYTLTQRMNDYNVPGVSIAVVQNGKLKWAKGYGIANSLTQQTATEYTLFQAASISKPVSALAVLKLMEEGKVDLDVDVNTYLKSWKIEENEFTRDKKVTLRGILTHTSGLNVSGFRGYLQHEQFPSLQEVLTGKGNNPAIAVIEVPGSTWRYSGGGYTVMQQVIEDISGLPFQDYMEKNVLQPLDMRNSTFHQPLEKTYHSRASAAYGDDGKIIPGQWHNYPELAAAGLWTTPSDLARYCIEVHEILSNKKRGLVSKETIEKMLTPHHDRSGLGPAVSIRGNSIKFEHSGKNAGFTNNLIAFAYEGHALIVMTNGDQGGKLVEEIQNSIFRFYGWE